MICNSSSLHIPPSIQNYALFVIIGFLLFSLNVQAQWCSNPAQNTPVHSGTRSSEWIRQCSDGNGGTFIFWSDYRNQLDEWSVQPDVYAQYIGADGYANWTANGIPIRTSPGNQNPVQAVSDGSGGAIVVWFSQIDGYTRAFAQRVNSAGEMLWNSSGVQVSDTGANDAVEITAVSDGDGGVILTWMMLKDEVTSGIDIFAQHINAAGNITWTPGGVAVCTVDHDQNYPKIVSDGNHGAIIVWTDFRDEDDGNMGNIYAQHVDSDGDLLWRNDGAPVTTVPTGSEVMFSVASDDNNGVIVAWSGYYAIHKATTYVQKLSALGSKVWGANGIGVTFNDSRLINVLDDGNNGAIVMWNEFPPPDYLTTVFAQRIQSDHSLAWGTNGLELRNSTLNDEYSTTCSNASDGNYLFLWREGYNELYSQKVTPTGSLLWGDNGLSVTTDSKYDTDGSIGSDDSGGSIVVFKGTTGTLKIQRVLTEGMLAGEFDPNTHVPEAPIQVYCQDGATNQPTLLSLLWNVTDQANTYRYQVATDTEFSTLIIDTSITDTIGVVPELQYSTTYYWRVSAENEFGISAWSDARDFTTVTEGTKQLIVKRGWNLISIPFTVNNYEKASVFPTAKSFAYEFVNGTGYVRCDILEQGKAYWLRFNNIQSIPVYGTNLNEMNIQVSRGWNLVGSITMPLLADRVVESTPSINDSYFMKYERGYTLADYIHPGGGYYIKANSAGEINLNESFSAQEKGSRNSVFVIVSQQRSIIVRDVAGNSQTLYYSSPEFASMAKKLEMPPSPPQSEFDVRFASNSMMAILSDKFAHDSRILVSSAKYPIEISWENNSTMQAGVLMVGEQRYSLDTKGSIKITDPNVVLQLTSDTKSLVQQIPTQYTLSQNYPNPFNPNTVIHYSLPASGYVTLKVFDLLGQEVATLVDGVQEAGFRMQTFDASSLPSGVYMYQLIAGNFSDMKKLVVMK